MTVPILPLPLMRIPVTIIHVIAIVATLARIRLRIRRKNFWWDDALASIAVILDAMYLVTFWLRNDSPEQFPAHVLRLLIILNWFHLTLGTTILWLARVSIMVAINRIVLPWGRLRGVAAAMPIVFVVFWLIVLSQKIWVCATTTRWHHFLGVQCLLSQPVPSVELGFDLLADGILFFIPFCVLRKIRLPPTTRRLILVTFATCIITTLSNLVYIAFMWGSVKWGTHLLVAVSAHIEATVSLTVCNLSVLIPAAYRAYRRFRGLSVSQDASEESELEHIHTSFWSLPQFLRTIPSNSQDERSQGVIVQSNMVAPHDVALRPMRSESSLTRSSLPPEKEAEESCV